jgi:ribosomal-protein-alanine N-acetyltransferase
MLTLRYMTIEDIPQVVAIDRLSFEPAWSANSYAYEINQSSYSHMVVLEDDTRQVPVVENWWQRLKHQFNGRNNGRSIAHEIVGYGGLWHIMDEAHISTIAVHPDFRGRGYGELLLVGMLHRALTLDAVYVVLEVRVSNTLAQNLYQKYEFKTVGTKSKYYHNNNEDAYDMRVNLTDAFRGRFFRRFEAVRERHPFEDIYSAVTPPQIQPD